MWFKPPAPTRLWTRGTCATSTVHNTTRSEEHTSELQSRLHLVCRLLLEKKKKLTIRRFLPCARQKSDIQVKTSRISYIQDSHPGKTKHHAIHLHTKTKDIMNRHKLQRQS